MRCGAWGLVESCFGDVQQRGSVAAHCAMEWRRAAWRKGRWSGSAMPTVVYPESVPADDPELTEDWRETGTRLRAWRGDEVRAGSPCGEERGGLRERGDSPPPSPPPILPSSRPMSESMVKGLCVRGTRG